MSTHPDTPPAEEQPQQPASEEAGTEQTPAEETKTDQAEQETAPASPQPDLPPEAQGEVNGGPLGCCLGVVIGLLLSISVALFSRLYDKPLYNIFSDNLPLLVRITMGLVAIAAAIVCGYFGWKIGKRFYREYEVKPPAQKKQKRKAYK